MINIALIHYYASMIEKKVIKLEEVPEDIREFVQKYINGEQIIEESSKSEEKKEEYIKKGAVYIAPIIKTIPKEFNKINSTNNEIYIKIPLEITDIFTEELLKYEPVPENVTYELILVEKQYTPNENESQLYVRIENLEGSDKLSITGYDDHDFNSGDKFLRCDVMMNSSNYESMRLVFYINIE